MQRFIPALGALSAVMGAGGVALAAAATHTGGGEMGQTAAYFLVLHAAALLGLTACARAYAADAAFARALLIDGAGLGLGTIVFSADLATRAFTGARLFPMAAPIGGSLMILGWLALALVFVWGAARRTG
ncbi:DUF423 domain-containing protein [Methylocapsa sp. S129]|uniref:DUF423 domain-containing protein n=1 Tax=Methylocapsa sp. S129 TaxID=1641869 RepID=UPI00131CE721|nr:DUF423 domain-containing protein [Methylocapsa sp. S129]